VDNHQGAGLSLMKRSKATRHERTLVLLLLLLLIAGLAVIFRRDFLVASSVRVAKPVHTVSRHPAPSTAATLADADQSSSSGKIKVQHAKVRARVRVGPGEAAVLAYYDVAPGKLGLTIVIPEARDGGQVSLQLRTLELADSAGVRNRAEELLPHIFELEKTGVISRARMEELLRSLLEDEGVKTVNYPSMVTQLGQACSIRNGVNYPTGEFLGVKYAVKADAVPGAGGYDLSVDFEHTGKAEDE
jgi:hypothetical protein